AATEATYVLRQADAHVAALTPDTVSVIWDGVDGATLAHGRKTVLDEFDEALKVVAPLRDCRPTDAAPLTHGERRCVRAMGIGVARVSAQVNAQVGRCLRAQAAGDAFDQCIDGDPTSRIRRASERTTKQAVERCTPFPPFGTARAGAVTDAARHTDLALVRDV